MSSRGPPPLPGSRAPGSVARRGRLLALGVLAGMGFGPTAPFALTAQATDTALAAHDFRRTPQDTVPIRLAAGTRDARLELVITRWGDVPDADADSVQAFTLSVVRKPDLVTGLAWSDGPRLVFQPTDVRKSVELRFDVAERVVEDTVASSDELVLAVVPEDETVVPGRRELVLRFDIRAPAVAAVRVCVPEDPERVLSVDVSEAHHHCDESIRTALVYEYLWVYFQPARDTTRTVWSWRIVRVRDDADTARVASGLYVPGGGPFDTTERAGEGAPTAFATRLGNLWYEDGPGPGTYVLQTCLPSAQAGALGQTSGWAGCLTPHIDVVTGEAEPLRPWQDEGRFQVGAATLTLQGFVAERGVAAWAEDRGPWLSLENVGSGAAAGADLVYTWDECVHPDEPDALTAPCDRHGEGWSARRRTDRARFALSLPEELDLQAPVLGELKASLTPSGDPRLERSAVLTPLVPGTEAARELAGTAPYDATGLVYPVRPDPPSGPFDPPTLAGDGRERAYLLRNEFRRDPGDPDRPMGIWARDASARWFLPIPIRAGGLTLHAFAVYGTRPGSYAGPVPEAPGSIPPLAQADDPGEDDPGHDGGEGDQPGMDDPGGEAGPGPGGEADIDGGEDVDGAQPGGEGVGEEQPGDEGVDAGEPDERDDPEDSDDSDDIVDPDAPGEDVPPALLADYRGWKAADAKAALEEAGYAVELRVAEEASSEAEAFTVARQEPAPGTRPGPGASVTLLIHGEYAPLALLPDVRGWPAADARRDLETLGFEVVVQLGEPALTRAGSNTVERQEPVGGGHIEAGSRVTLWVRDEFVPPDDVPPAPAVVTDTADVVPPARDSTGVVPARADTAGVGPVQTDTVRVVPPAPDSAAVVPPEPAGCPTRASGAPEFEIGPGFLVQWVWHSELGVYCGYMRSGGGLNQYMLEPEGNGYFLRTHDRPGQPSRRVMRFERGETPDPSTGWLQAGEVFRIEPDGSLRSISWWFARPPTPSR